MVSHSMHDAEKTEDTDLRITIVWKKECQPSEEALSELKCSRSPAVAEAVKRKKDALEQQAREVLEHKSGVTAHVVSAPTKVAWADKAKYKKIVAAQPELVAVNQVKRDLRTIPELEAELLAKKKKKKEAIENSNAAAVSTASAPVAPTVASNPPPPPPVTEAAKHPNLN